MNVVYLDFSRLVLPKRVALAVMLLLGKRTRVRSPRSWVTVDEADQPSANWTTMPRSKAPS